MSFSQSKMGNSSLKSPSLKLIQLLLKKGAKVSYNDPYIPEIKLPHDTLANDNIIRLGE